MRKIILAFIVCFPLYALAQAPSDEISKVLNSQSEAWNNGDIEGFMKYYWKSEDIRFVSKNGISMGWQKVYDNYIKGYPDKAAMGKLTFDHLDYDEMNSKTYMVTGSWQLEYNDANGEDRENTGGWFTLIFKKFKKDWRIIYDHTS